MMGKKDEKDESPIGTTIFALAVMTIIPIAMIVIGAQHLDDCPMEPWIPKCMVVGGGTSLALLLVILMFIVADKNNKTNAVKFASVLFILIVAFLFAWCIASSYWVFKEWSGWDKVKDDIKRGCHKEVYLFIFSFLILTWVSVPCYGGSARAHTSIKV